MNKIFKLILVLSLLIFSAVSISGCSSEKEKIAKEYTGVWRADKKSAWTGSDQQYYFIFSQNKTNENILDVTLSIFDKNNSAFSSSVSNKEPELSSTNKTNAIIDEKLKTIQLQDLFKTQIIITTEGNQKFINYDGKKFVKISNEPNVPELKDIKF